MSEIKIPEGFRVLDSDEYLREGDMFKSFGEWWEKTTNVGDRAGEKAVYIRSIKQKGEE